MYSKRMVVPIRFNLSCFELLIKWNGELEYVFTDDDGEHRFDTDGFTEICRAFDSVEFTAFVEAHNAYAESYEKYGDAYAELYGAYGLDRNSFTIAVDDFERSIERRIACKTSRDDAHANWQTSCELALDTAEINFYTLCTIGSRMLGVDYFTLIY